MRQQLDLEGRKIFELAVVVWLREEGDGYFEPDGAVQRNRTGSLNNASSASGCLALRVTRA